MVAGVRYAELRDVIARRVAQVFKNFQISVSLAQLRGVRVYITGFVQRPGCVLGQQPVDNRGARWSRQAGPSAAGSFRKHPAAPWPHTRDGPSTSTTCCSKATDRTTRVVQPDDVIHVGPQGQQVALIGSVNQPAIFELKPGRDAG